MALIVPDVYSQITREKFLGKVRVALLASNLGDLKNTTVGDTIHFPKFKTLSDANTVVKGTQSTIDSLDEDDSTAKIAMKDKIVRVFDIDDMTALGNQINEASNQQAIVFARALDQDLVTEASTTPLKQVASLATAISVADLDTAIGQFGDDADVDDMAGIVVNSKLDASFYGMDAFVDVNKTFTTNGNGIVKNGMLGFYRGIPVFHTNHGTWDSTNNECRSFVIKKNALAYMEKRAINIVEEREEKLHCSDIVGTYIYAVKLIDEAGVVEIKKTTATA